MAAAPAAAAERNLRRFIAPPRVCGNSLPFENDGLLAHTQRECNHSDDACRYPLLSVLCERLAGRADLPRACIKKRARSMAASRRCDYWECGAVMPPGGDDPTRSTASRECELRRPRTLSQVPSRWVQCVHVTLAVVEAGPIVPHRRNPPSRTDASNRLTRTWYSDRHRSP